MSNQRTTKGQSESLLMSREGRKEKRQNHGGKVGIYRLCQQEIPECMQGAKRWILLEGYNPVLLLDQHMLVVSVSTWDGGRYNIS